MEQQGALPPAEVSLAMGMVGSGIPPAMDMSGIPPAMDMSGIPPAMDMSGIPPAMDMSGIPPAMDMSGIPPAMDMSGIAPVMDMSGIAPAMDMSGIAPAMDMVGSGVPSGLGIDFSASGLTVASPIGPASVGSPADATAGALDIRALRKMIAPLSKEQLIELLANAALSHGEVYAACASMVKESPASRRLMIRNIAFSTKNEDFVKLFSQFGDIDDAAIVRDRENKSKGYGFVTFRTAEGVEQCFLAKELVLDGRRLLAKLAGDPYADFSTGGPAGTRQQEGSRRKLFVRNLADRTDSETLHDIFSQYGPLEECVVVCNSEGRSRGYGFVTFQNPEAAIKAVQQPQRVVDGKVAFVAFATPTRTRNPASATGPAAMRRNTGGGGDPSSPAMRVQSIHANIPTQIAPNLYSPYNPTGYPAVMPFYSHPPTSQGAFGSQPVGLPVGNYDYMTAVAATPHARRY